MTGERRKRTRYILDGLLAALDGVEHDILDASVGAIRLLRRDPSRLPPRVARLGLWNEAGHPPVAIDVTARLVRHSRREMVYAYRAGRADWASILPLFDSFVDLRVAELED